MKKIFLVLFFALILSACTNSDNTTPSNDRTVDSNVSTVTLSEEEALTIAEKVLDDLVNATYPYKIGEYDLALESNDYSDVEWTEIYTLQQELLEEYATLEFIDSNIEYNYLECEHACYIHIPTSLAFAWKPTVTVTDDNHFELKGLISPDTYIIDDQLNSLEQTVYFVLQDGDWKVKKFNLTSKDMNLTVEDIEDYLKTQSFTHIDSDKVIETFEYKGREEEIVRFYDNDLQGVYVLFLRNGYVIFEGEEGLDYYDETNHDYSIGNDEELLTHDLFYDWSIFYDEIDTTNEKEKQFFETFNDYDQQRQTAYNAGNVDELQNIVDGISVSITHLYDYYYEQWDEEERLNQESGNRDWYQQMMRYFAEVVPADTPELDRLNDEARIRLSYAYGLLVTN